jgi:hypothetical protein
MVDIDYRVSNLESPTSSRHVRFEIRDYVSMRRPCLSREWVVVHEKLWTEP